MISSKLTKYVEKKDFETLKCLFLNIVHDGCSRIIDRNGNEPRQLSRLFLLREIANNCDENNVGDDGDDDNVLILEHFWKCVVKQLKCFEDAGAYFSTLIEDVAKQSQMEGTFEGTIARRFHERVFGFFRFVLIVAHMLIYAIFHAYCYCSHKGSTSDNLSAIGQY